jgi:hypothetical protein
LKAGSADSGKPAGNGCRRLRVEIEDDYDSEKMFNSNGGEIYTFPAVGDGVNASLVINGLPSIQAGDSIPLGFASRPTSRAVSRSAQKKAQTWIRCPLICTTSSPAISSRTLGLA